MKSNEGNTKKFCQIFEFLNFIRNYHRLKIIRENLKSWEK